ncbi:Uma2 family endonuclease [Kribbella sp. CA-253562]|uniref:Uma2 family endonuclease n=1 Tax=Kribbella sp. CA-253562 TaxID=3239942 RepID=UPI003D928A0B
MTRVEPTETDRPMPWAPFQALTRSDLELIPNDGHRYELVDGVLIMTPAPSWRHQIAVSQLLYQLMQVCPADLRVLTAPFDVAISDDTVLQPDILVARRDDFTERDLPKAPLLAVEVLSPSTRRIDLMVKLSRYEAAGCASYWVVDTDTPSLIAWEMQDGAYAQVTKVSGDEPARLRAPYEVEVVPADLIV